MDILFLANQAKLYIKFFSYQRYRIKKRKFGDMSTRKTKLNRGLLQFKTKIMSRK